MGLISRIIRVVKGKLNVLVSSQENPVEQLELTYQEMEEKRRDVKTSVTDVKAQKKRLEKKKEGFEADVEKHNRQAEEAMSQDREDLARAALEKKKSKMAAVVELEKQIS